jgi:hypothetical protein
MPYFEELPLSAQTAYAQLLDSALSADHLRSIADLPGSFAQKTVKWTSYWYTANLFSRRKPIWGGVTGEPEIVEDDAGTQTKFAHHGGD